MLKVTLLPSHLTVMVLLENSNCSFGTQSQVFSSDNVQFLSSNITEQNSNCSFGTQSQVFSSENSSENVQVLSSNITELDFLVHIASNITEQDFVA